MDLRAQVRSGAIQTRKRRPSRYPELILLLSNFTRALEMPENRSQKRRLQVQPQIIVRLERKVAGLNPERDEEDFSEPFLF